MEAPPSLPFLTRVTPTLGALVGQYQATLAAEPFAALVEGLRAHHRRFASTLAALPSGPLRAAALHRLVDAQLTDLPGLTPSCRPGCGLCCHYEVEVTHDEAALLASVVASGLPIDRVRLARQAARERRAAEWSALVVEENRCVFLDGAESCRVHPQRPAACRKHLVVSPPVECGRPSGAPRPVTVPLAELAISVALSLPDNAYTSLPKGLAALLSGPAR
jgi:hypothetical protein